jgi:transcriptional regulator with GAF, ATPase, and Fis domain
MDAFISGRTVYGQQVGDWILEQDPTASLNFISAPRDLDAALRRGDRAQVFVIVADLEGDKRVLALLSALSDEGRDGLTILCSCDLRDELASLLPSWLRPKLAPFGEAAVAAAVSTPSGDLELDFDDPEQEPEVHFDSMVGESSAMLAVYQRVEKVAPTQCSCLVTGESGTGKELVARAVYDASPRSDAPYVTLNSGSIPRELIESQLFGHEKGAFTGAVGRQKGMFEVADGGVMLIDEIGELPLEVQPVLLRVLQDGEIVPVGATRARKVDVRFIAATHRDLWAEVEDGNFREDLFYRLDVVPVQLPPLRERREDIPLLISHHARLLNEKHGLRIAGMTRGCLEALQRYRWPGNVRQLLHILERMMVLAEGAVLDVADLPSLVSNQREESASVTLDVPDDGLDFYAETERFQKAILNQVLERVSWNKNQAANLLRMNRTTLVERLKRLGMTPQVDADTR